MELAEIHISTAQVYPILILILTLQWRFLLTGRKRHGYKANSDNLVHNYYLKKHTERTGFRRIFTDEQFQVKSRTFYPQLFHMLIAKTLGYKLFQKYQGYINPITDAVFNVMLYLYIEAAVGLNRELAHHSKEIAFWVSLLYIYSPIMFFFKSRIAAFGERLFAFVIGFTVLLLTVEYLDNYTLPLFIAMTALNVIILYASQFTMQVIILFQLAQSLINWDGGPVLSVAAAFAISFLISGRRIYWYLEGKYRHFRWYNRGLKDKKIFLDFIYRNYWRRMLLFGLLYLYLAYEYPAVKMMLTIAKYQVMQNYIIVSVVIFFLVYIPVFRPYGEAHRYLEYSYPFALFFFVMIGIQRENIAILVVYLAINFFSTLYYLTENAKDIDDDRSLYDMLAYLKKHQDKVLVTIPLKLSYFFVTNLENRVVNSNTWGPELDHITKHYDSIINDFEKIKKEYRCDWVIYRRGVDRTYDFSRYNIVYQNAKYIIFEI